MVVRIESKINPAFPKYLYSEVKYTTQNPNTISTSTLSCHHRHSQKRLSFSSLENLDKARGKKDQKLDTSTPHSALPVQECAHLLCPFFTLPVPGQKLRA